MPKLSLWKGGLKTNNYNFIDNIILGMYTVGGTSLLLHKFIGIIPQNDHNDSTLPPPDPTAVPETQIQDLLLLENRDRNYDPNVYEIKCVYNVQDAEFDLRQFGLFLENDNLFVSIHLNDTVNKIGRKPMSGDVIELPHRREDLFLNNQPAVNKFYSVEDVNYEAQQYSPTWFPHGLRLKIKPLVDSQEFRTILDQKPNDRFGNPEINSAQLLKDIISSYPTEIGISEAVIKQAEKEVPFRNFEINQFYLSPRPDGNYYLWVYGGSDVPPDGAMLTGRGDSFPVDPADQEFFLRTDYEPHVLYQFNTTAGYWHRIEVDYRMKWSKANRLLESFINDRKTTNLGPFGQGGLSFPERQPISKILKPKSDVGYVPPTINEIPGQD